MSEIAVITPFYEGFQHLPTLRGCIAENAEALRSAEHDGSAACCAPILEWIVVNDSPWAELRQEDIAVSGAACSVISYEENRGIHGARVAGLQATDARYVMFLDQDDEIRRDCLSTLLAAIGDSDVAVSNAVSQEMGGVSEDLYTKRCDLAKVSDFGFYLRITNPIRSPGQCLLRRESIPSSWMDCIVRNNGSDDLLLWMLMLHEGASFTVVPERLYVHKDTGMNVSGSDEAIGASSYEVADILERLNALTPGQIATLRRSIAWYLPGARRLAMSNADLIGARMYWKARRLFSPGI